MFKKIEEKFVLMRRKNKDNKKTEIECLDLTEIKKKIKP